MPGAAGSGDGGEVGAGTVAALLPYARFLGSMSDGALLAAADGRVVFANEAAVRILGVSRGELLVPLASVPERLGLRAPGGALLAAVALRALAGEIEEPVEGLIRTPDGREMEIRTSATPLRADHGGVIGAVVVIADLGAAKAEAARAREQAEALRESEARARAISENIRDALVILHAVRSPGGEITGWRYVDANEGALALLGTTRERLVGRTIREVLPERSAPAEARMARVLATGVPERYEATYGDTALIVTIFRIDEHTVGSAALDITDRKRAEEALRQSEAQLRRQAELVQHAPVLVRDADDRIVVWSAGMERLYGYRPDEAIGAVSHALLRTRFPLPLPEITAALLRDGRWEGELLHRKRDGAEAAVTSLWVLHRDEQGTPEAIIEVNNDITARREAETRAEFLARFPEENPDPVLRIRAGDRLVYANEAARSLLAALGHDGRGAAPPTLAGPAREVVETGRTVRSELACGDRYYSLHFVPVNGEVNVYGHDTTARRLAEDALREADERKTEFLGILSHELRNPLAPIRNSIYLLDRVAPDSPQAARAKEVVRRQSEHLTRLVDDLLDVTRISRGKIQLRREVLDVCDVVRRTSEDHRSLLDHSGIELRLDLPAEPLWADVDPTRLGQIVGNLIQNANKFTPAGGVVTVSVRERDGRLEILIRDTGIGMEPGQVERMFHPFVQEERSLARTLGGLGLGLALAKGLMELHGGTIAARSEGAGRGAEFVLTLPLAAAPGSRGAPAHAASARWASDGLRVLIIEDNADAAQTLADVLELEGHDVRIARDGSTGIAMARELKPDVVLCDIGLPDLDGYEVARALRQDASLRSTRLVALSGYAQPEDKSRAGEAGFDAHLSKPSPVEELKKALLA